MKHLLGTLLLALLMGLGVAAPASSEPSGPVRSRSVNPWTDGLRFTERSTSEYGEEARPRRRYHRHEGNYRKRYAARKHARTAKQMRRHHRTARRHGTARKAAVHRPQAPVKKQAAATPPTAETPPAPKLGKRSLGSDGSKAGGARGVASYYWQPQRVAAGGWFNPNAMTAAHKTLPFGTRVRVTHLGNGRSVEVKINDRGPYIAGRIIDLSKAAAGIIGMTGQGIARVAVEVLGR